MGQYFGLSYFLALCYLRQNSGLVIYLLLKQALGFQFMKRTREKTEIMEEEEIRSQMFDSEVDDSNEICLVTMF